MKSIAAWVAVLAISVVSALAQVTVRGRAVRADDGQPVAGAYVMINASQPGVSARTGMTDMDGNFSIVSRMPQTEITLKFSGLRDFMRVIRPEEGTFVDLGTVRLQPDAIVARAVEARALAPLATMHGDTLQYSATAFKTNPDASSEDLLKKMPGVTTDDDGKVEVHGEAIGKVYVDGKEYFSEDPATALATLPADVVENLQIFEDRSDDAKFSGFDDGERIKAINIVTKDGVSTSTFGKAYAGYASDDRYTVGAAANIFNNDHRVTLLGQRNNINNQGFTLNDIASSMSGGRRGMGGGIDASQFTTNVGGGVRTSTNAGINYQGDFEKLEIGANYAFNHVAADQHRTREQYYTSMDRQYGDTSGAQGYNYQHRFYARMEWNPNETNRIRFMPRVNYSTNHGTSFGRSLTWMDGVLSNRADNRYTSRLGTYDASANLFWMHRFAKPGRVLSLGGSAGGGNGWGHRTQRSDITTLEDGFLVDSLVDQYGTLSAPQFNVMGRMTYSEALSKASRLQLSYHIQYNDTESDKLIYDYDVLTDAYTDPNDLISSLFDRNQTRQGATLGYNLVQEKVVLNASVGYQYNALNNDETLPGLRRDSYSFDAVLPRLRFEFRPTKLQSLTLDYNRSTSTPNVTQLQEIVDATNPLQVFYGNPALRQSYTDRLQLRYNIANPEKSTNFNVNAQVSFVQDYIAYDRRFLTQDEQVMGVPVARGAQVSTPVNLNGYISGRLFSNYSFRINPLMSNLNIGAWYRYARTPSMENGVAYKASNNVMGLNLSLTSNISEKIDFTLMYRPSLNLTRGSTGSFDRQIQSNLSGFLNVYLVGGLYIGADATWRNAVGTREAYTQHYALLNAAIGYKFLKFRQAEFKLSGYDLLDQNQARWFQSYDTYTQINTTNILKRYVMLSFTYKFDTRKGRTAANFGAADQPVRGGRGGGRGR